MTLNLCLIESKQYEGKDGNEKIKLIFESDKGQFYAGYANLGSLNTTVEEMTTVEGYDSEYARDLEVSRDLFDGKLTYKVVIS